MSIEWSNDRELMFLELYQSEPVLWQSRHADHKNKNKVYDAWIRISEIMEIPVPELKKKKDSLMSSYRTYRKKVKDSTHSGASSDEVYKPIWFAYETMNSFLGDVVACNKTINTEESANNETSEETQEADQQIMPKTIRRRKNPSELLIAGETVKDCLSTLKTTLRTRQPQEEDECDLHGKIIAKKLRLLPEDEREQFVCEIYQMFRNRNRHSRSIYSPARSETPEYFSPARTHISTPSPSPLQQQRATSSRSTYSEPPMQQQRATSSRSTYSEPPMQQQRATRSRSTYSEPPMQQQRQRATSSPGISSESPMQQQRATTVRNIYSESPMQQQRATTVRNIYSESPMQQQRATTVRNIYSESPMQQQRATTARNIYSESPMQQQRATSARSTCSESPIRSIYSGPPIQQTMYSESLLLDPPVISIPEEASTAGDSSVIILRNELIQQAHDDHTYCSDDTSDQPTKDSTDYDNLIEQAFRYA